MAGSNPNTTVQKIRTFAADFAAAKAAHAPAEPVVTEPAKVASIPAASASPAQPSVPPTPAAPVQPTPTPTPPPLPKPSTANPPFHSLQSSSAAETVIDPKKVTQPASTAVLNKFAGGTIKPKKTAHADRESILDDRDEDIFKIPSENENFGRGSIVTDKRRNRPSFFKAVAMALRGWATKKFHALTDKKPLDSRRVVPAASTRESTIKQAAAVSALAPRDDHQVVTKQLTPATPSAPTITPAVPVVAKPQSSGPSWSYIEDDEPAAASEPVIAEAEPTIPPAPRPVAPPPANLPIAPQAAPVVEVPEPEPTPAPLPTPEPKPQPVITRPTPPPVPVSAPAPIEPPEPAPAPLPVRPARSTITPNSVIRTTSQIHKPAWAIATEPPATPTPTPVFTPPAPEPEPEPEPTPAPLPTPEPVSAQIEPAPVLARTWTETPAERPSSSRWLTRVVTLGVILLAIGLGVSTAWWLFGMDTPTVTVVTPILSDVPTDRQIPIPVSSRTEIMRALTAAQATAPTGITQLYLTAPDETGVPQAQSGETTFIALELGAPGNFIRAIERVTLGTIDGQTPFMVIKVASFDAALSGMIAWEASMSSDLEPLFGNTITRTFDPDARTTDQIRPAFFTDTLINNRDVRLLRDEFANDALLYSFIDRQTIILTTNRDAFATLLPLVQ